MTRARQSIKAPSRRQGGQSVTSQAPSESSIPFDSEEDEEPSEGTTSRRGVPWGLMRINTFVGNRLSQEQFKSEASASSWRERQAKKLAQDSAAGRTWRKRLNYFLDRVLAKRWSFFLALAVLGLNMVLFFGLLATLTWKCRTSELDFDDCDSFKAYAEGLWIAWTLMADPGTQEPAGTTITRLVSAVISVGGILFMASILGVVVDMVREKMDTLRQGKSRIVETRHTLILGWTEKTLHIIEELINANESEGGGVVAVLAPVSKEVMEAELALQIPKSRRKKTRVVLRTGSPLVLGDLVRVSVQTAKAIMVLASTGNADRADSDTLRTMLLLRTMSRSIKGHVVAEVRDIDNEPLVAMVGGRMTDTLVSHDMVGRLMLLSARQPGLAKVYESLLGFEGDEFYKEEWPQLVGTMFRELQRHFPDAVPIGVYTNEEKAWLSPPPDYVMQPGDQVMVLAEDNNTYSPAEPVDEDAGEAPSPEKPPQKVEKILFCGWRRDIRDLLQQLDRIVERGSEVHMMTHCVPLSERTERLLEDGLDVRELKNLVIVHHYGNTSVRRKLESLPIEQYTSCMIFADQAFEADTMHADSHSLATLLLIRDIQVIRSGTAGKSTFMGETATEMEAEALDLTPRSRKAVATTNPRRSVEEFWHAVHACRKETSQAASSVPHTCPIICEILDPHTQRTVADSKHLSLASDFCQSNKLIAQVLTMVSEDRTVKIALDELLGSTGVSIAVVPASRYVRPGELLSFYSVVDRAFTFGEIVIGYQIRRSLERTILNPTQKDMLMDWLSYDFAILEKGDNYVEASKRRQSIWGDSAEGFARKEIRESIREVVRDAHSREAFSRSDWGSHEDMGRLHSGGFNMSVRALDSGVSHTSSHLRPPLQTHRGGSNSSLLSDQSLDSTHRLAMITRRFLKEMGEANLCPQVPLTPRPVGFASRAHLNSAGFSSLNSQHNSSMHQYDSGHGTRSPRPYARTTAGLLAYASATSAHSAGGAALAANLEASGGPYFARMSSFGSAATDSSTTAPREPGLAPMSSTETTDVSPTLSGHQLSSGNNSGQGHIPTPPNAARARSYSPPQAGGMARNQLAAAASLLSEAERTELAKLLTEMNLAHPGGTAPPHCQRSPSPPPDLPEPCI